MYYNTFHPKKKTFNKQINFMNELPTSHSSSTLYIPINIENNSQNITLISKNNIKKISRQLIKRKWSQTSNELARPILSTWSLYCFASNALVMGSSVISSMLICLISTSCYFTFSLTMSYFMTYAYFNFHFYYSKRRKLHAHYHNISLLVLIWNRQF
jgi:hypothetical protein